MNTPICRALAEHSAKNYIKFHTGSRASLAADIAFPSDFQAWDFTELPGLDNLHCPSGVILEAQELAADAFGAERTFFSVNGSTAAILALILGSFNPGDTIVLDRGSHVSAFNACILAQLKVVLVHPVFQDGIPVIQDINLFLEAAKKNKAKGVFLTRPNYYGCATDLLGLSKDLHKLGKFILVDEAHGTHFGFNPFLPMSAIMSGADGVAQSAHKTLGALNQTAFLHVNGSFIDISRVEQALSMVQTTSPSYPLLASLDYSRAWLEKEGFKKYEILINAVDLFWEKLKPPFRKAVTSVPQDPTRLTIRTDSMDGNKVAQELREDFGIQVEFSNENYLVCIAVPGDEHELISLAEALNQSKCAECESADLSIVEEFPPGVPDKEIYDIIRTKIDIIDNGGTHG